MGTAEANAKNQKTLAMFDKAIQRTPEKMIQAFDKVLTDLEAQGVKRAPIKHGFLRASIEKLAVVIKRSVGLLRLEGGVAARRPYALVQHENLEFRHPKGGEAQYLLRPLVERQEMYRESLMKAAREALKESKG